MKKKILSLAKELGKKIEVDANRLAFDVIQYVIFYNGKEDTFVYFTGKTSNGVEYLIDNNKILNAIKKFLLSV